MFDIKKIPFSRFNSFLTISTLFKSEKLFLRSVRGGDFDVDYGKIFEINLLDENNNIIDYEIEFKEHELILFKNEKQLRITIEDNSTIHFSGRDMKLRLTRKMNSYDNIINLGNDFHRINLSELDIKIISKILKGDSKYKKKNKILECTFSGKNEFHLVLEEFKFSPIKKEYNQNFDIISKNNEEIYKKWLDSQLKISKNYNNGEKISKYILWSSVVPKGENLSYRAMYMSKNWMTNIWSWDNCFNAMAQMKKNPELAWEQLIIFFDHQSKDGSLPDFINDKFSYYNFTKPPIYGLTLKFFLKHNKKFLTREKLEYILPKIEKFTNYWFEFTDYYQRKIPSYNHGNDSGWDNSTIFQNESPVESPDLLALLINQMFVLAEISEILKNKEKKEFWNKRAEKFLKILLDDFWNGEQFYPKYPLLKDEIYKGDSLIAFIPVILGKKLPEKIRKKIISGLKEKNRFLTKNGLATESISSDFYKENGYWRGPIWAPSTFLIFLGLLECQEFVFAEEIAEKFVKMANENGMAENFDALSGKGLCDPAFTWTSSVFLMLGNYLKKNYKKKIKFS